MIRGIGVDICSVERFSASLARTPSLRERLFTPAERSLNDESLAARFAAKEALSKALGVPRGMSWQDCTVVSAPSGAPSFELTGTVLAAVGHARVHLSLSHDAGLATAYVVVED